MAESDETNNVAGPVTYDVADAGSLDWVERESQHGQAPRSQASVTDAAQLTQSRARLWRYPARTRGRRPQQENLLIHRYAQKRGYHKARSTEAAE